MIERALIVGGGPAGMSSAIALARQGVYCEIVEKNPDWSPAGIGIGLHSAPLRALKSLALFDPVAARGWPHQHINMLMADGTPVAQLPQSNVNGPDDPPFITMTRMTLHQVLEERLRSLGVKVRTGTTVRELGDSGAAVSAELSDDTRSPREVVIGADGLHSQLREVLFPEGPSPEFCGQVIWRIGVRRPAALEHYTMMVAGPTRIGLVPLTQDEVYVWMLDATLPPQRPPREHLLELFRERLSAYAFVAPEILEQMTSSEQVDFRALYWLLLPPPWHAGRVVLVGDAAHTATPHLAYRVGLAFEDAVVLGELVAEGAGADELGQALGETFAALAEPI